MLFLLYFIYINPQCLFCQNVLLCILLSAVYDKTFEGGSFTVFAVFYPYCEVFPMCVFTVSMHKLILSLNTNG